jgi:maltose alpha-D-glucosyltransferase/alpha-amylase
VASNFRLLLDCSKTRIHGDYHLGQTLRTSDGQWIILDFEGEPARTIEERRAKSSPLRDVAGMLRSFNYARGITARDIGQEQSSDLARWESETREAFLDGYFGVARPGLARFLPKATDDAQQALRAWELQKALYEVLYELDNRPSWAWLPLTATLKLA